MDIERVGKAIAYLRKRAGYTQKDLADRIGISDKTVSKWERGLGLPEIGYLRRLSILLDTDSDSLLAGDVVYHKRDWRGIIVLDRNPYGVCAGTVIYDKPLIYFLLSYFLLVGIRNIYVVCSDHDRDYIMRELGNGSDYGVNLRIHTDGLRSVLRNSETVSCIGMNHEPDIENGDDGYRVREGNVMMVYGRCFLYGVDQTRFFQKAMIDRNRFTMLALPKKNNCEAQITVDINKRVLDRGKNRELFQEHGSDELRTQYDFSGVPILFFPESILPEMCEASDVCSFMEDYKTKGEMFVEILDRGFVEIEVNSWDDVQDASIFLRIVQERCGMNVYCLEEVAWRRGMISLRQLEKLGQRHGGSKYGEYILGLVRRQVNGT